MKWIEVSAALFQHFNIGSIDVPTYGFVVLAGIIFINIIAMAIIQNNRLDQTVFAAIEFWGGVGAIMGAKLLAAIEIFIVDPESYRQSLESAATGYSYYGGLFGFLVAVHLYKLFTKTDFRPYAVKMVFLLPLLHGIWKIGCFLGGCCIGVPYNGIFAVIYPAGINSLSGTECFPIQLVETVASLAISLLLFIQGRKRSARNPLALYLILYGSTRFILEFFRHHAVVRAIIIPLIMSLVCITLGFKMHRNSIVEEYEK